jgi:hypothetical protein
MLQRITSALFGPIQIMKELNVNLIRGVRELCSNLITCSFTVVSNANPRNFACNGLMTTSATTSSSLSSLIASGAHLMCWNNSCRGCQ